MRGAAHTLSQPRQRQTVVSNGGVECATEVLRRHAANPCLVQKVSTVIISCIVDPQNCSNVSDVPDITLEVLLFYVKLSKIKKLIYCDIKMYCLLLVLFKLYYFPRARYCCLRCNLENGATIGPA